ncbi:MAG: hypothetical protein RL268_298 [Pseudomonadota bacterium]|jgi:hypothetical protein
MTDTKISEAALVRADEEGRKWSGYLTALAKHGLQITRKD